MDPAGQPPALQGFLASYGKDRKEGKVRPLADYLQAFPEVSLSVVREYVFLEGGRWAPSLDQDQVLALESFRWAYLAAGGEEQERPLEEWQARFPKHRDVIAQEWARLRESRAAGATRPAPERESPEASGAHSSGAERVGPFRLVREIGRGGQGLVYLAEDERLHRRVALKVLTGWGTTSEASLQRFRREAELASKLDHPGICTIFDAGIEQTVPYIAMRYVEGETLARKISTVQENAGEASGIVILSEAKLQPRTGADGAVSSLESGGPTTHAEVMHVVRLVEQAAHALHAAHEAGVIHRDVKPGNIMVTTEGDPVILDFGLARELDGDLPTLTRPGDLFGTPAYMSPEQLAHQSIRLDRRSDVWSLGVTLYECLTLRRPFEAPTREALYQAIMTKEPRPLRGLNPHVPRDLEVVIATALEKDRDRRYQTALDLAADLRRIREFQPIQARPAGPILRLRRWYQRNPALATAVTGFMLVLVAGLALALWFLGEKASDLAHITRLADARRIQELKTAADGFWAGFPDNAADIERWLARAGELAGRLPEHRRTLARIEALDNATDEERWQRDVLAGLVRDAEAELEGAEGLRARLAARLDRVKTFGSAEDRRRSWDAAIAAIAQEPLYKGVRIEPQTGLIPIGPDPDSKLWEFAHPVTGEIPERDTASGRLRIDGRSCIVLVLLPGGTFTMGAQRKNEKEPNFDRLATRSEGPVHDVTLRPFFIAKHEVTQGQWTRITGENPSMYRTAATGEDSLQYPVDQVSWQGIDRVCQRLGLALPTEAQWEYACRAGSVTPAYGPLNEVAWCKSNSERRPHGVGLKTPNAFGLHDMLGNVYEWCADWFDEKEFERHDRVATDPQGPPTGESRVCRGGSWATTGFGDGDPFCRATWRLPGMAPHTSVNNVGFRVAKTL